MMMFQLLSVPVFLQYWGVNLYGEWLALISLTAYFQMTDIGLNTATANSFTFCYVQGNYEKCNVLINNNIFFILLAFIVIFIIILIFGHFDFFYFLFKFSIIEHNVVNKCLLLLFSQVMIGTFNNLLNTIYIALDKYARGIMIDNIIRISEYTGLMLGVIFQLTVLKILIVGVFIKIVGLIFKYFDSQRYYKLTISQKFLRKAELREIFLPALSFFSYPLANSFSLQGVTLVVNFFLGSTSVVLFNTTRTLVNFSRSTIDILHKSIWPEISIAYGKLNMKKLRKIHCRTLIFTFILVLLTSIVLHFVGEYIYNAWTKNTLDFDKTLFNLLLLTLITNSIWSTSNVFLQATNNHKEFSLIYLLSSCLILGTTFLIVYTFNTISLIPMSMLIIDLFLFFYVIRKSFQITEDSYKGLKNSLLFEFNKISRTIFNLKSPLK